MSEQQNILRLRIKTSPESFLFLAGRSDATIFKKFAIKFTGRSNCQARKIKNNSNILSETASDKPCAGQALSEYTQATEKYFPKEDAKDGGVLRALRRHILAPGSRPREDTSSSKGNKYHRKDSRR